MDPTKLTIALIRLSALRIGIREAATLFLIRNGATINQLCEALGEDKVTVRGRINALRAKRLVSGSYNIDGTATYSPTPQGLLTIHATLQ